MSERCGCGAELLADLPFCITCGSRRPAPLVPAGARGPRHRPTPRPTPMPTPVRVPAPRQAPTPMPAPMPAFAAHPAPAHSAVPWIVGSASVVVIAIAAAVAVVMMRPAAVVHDAAAPAPVVVTSVPSATTSSSTSSSSTLTGASALQAGVETDRSAVESLDGQWVPQLSSKHPGTVDNGTAYDSSAIYAHYRTLASSHPGALLLWSGDWSTYKESDYWVVVEGQGFTSAAGANAWCSAQGFGPDDCFAKRLSHTAGPAGSFVPRH